MSTLNPNIPTAELAGLLTAAAAQREKYHVRLLTPQLLLRTFLDNKDSIAYQILKRLAKDKGFDLAGLVTRVEQTAKLSLGRDAHFNFTDDFGQDIPLAEETLVVIDEGLSLAKSREELKVSSGHALAAMTNNKVTTYGLLQQMGITTAAVLDLLDPIAGPQTQRIYDHIEQAKQGQADAYYIRTPLIRELMTSLALADKRHIILVGPEGAGKRTLVYSLAQQLASQNGQQQLSNSIRSVVEINETALLEDPLAAMRAGLRRASGGILLVPAIDRFFAGRLHATFPQQVSHDLHKAMLNNDHVIIGTVTQGTYDQHLADERIIRQRTNKINVPPATNEEALAMLGFHKRRLEEEYDLKVEADALSTAVSIASQYIKTIALPASAVQLADRACGYVRMLLQEHQANLPNNTPRQASLDKEDVLMAASLLTKIPIAKLGQDEQSRYANMVEHIQKRIIGQEEAVLAVSRAVKTARVGLRNPKRPIGSFLFLGPSGVGKSELAKALAEFMFGTEDAMLVLDMSEYQEEASVNRLIGAPPGYIGFEGGGQLTDFVREKPYTVVLFDEIEKAHPRVLDILLQVMDEGRLTDSQGRLTTFSETVIIMTSNLGAQHMLVPIIGERERELVLADMRRFLRPEFINRLDEVILFHQLTPDQLALILDLMLKSEYKLTAAKGLTLNLTPAAKQWLLAQNDQPEFGARPLRRIIARHLREPLADYLLSQTTPSSATITIDAGDDKLTFNFDTTPTPPPHPA
ncbi:MAG TPA: ATP-dependent Clp protease ATP-binding subunit [Anaerolineae bacterium]|nr:ATP-dependent Clp protease ATP-binding subunit [Anaerolineae bacterium]